MLTCTITKMHHHKGCPVGAPSMDRLTQPCGLTFRAWSMLMKDGIMDFRSVYLSCHSRSALTVGSDATKN